ncbi:hypothetical protein [Herbiconiux sp.]|uniref:hypothetical protein n=1 Tax=Herbiconiux sp. TaxID=1871186 RepID=UPI0025C22084|nr:hypothetical protein [Herbiconiux sp.]
MSLSGGRPERVAVLSQDEAYSAGLREWFRAHDPELAVVLESTRWGDLLQAADFPPELVLLDAATSGRSSVASRVRTVRASGAAVIVLSRADEEDAAAAQLALSSGAFSVLPKSVPLGLIGEVARAAVGLGVVTAED